MVSVTKNNSWAKYGLKTVVGIVLLLAMFILGRVTIAQDKANDRIGALEQRTSVEETLTKEMGKQLDRIEDKVDRILQEP